MTQQSPSLSNCCFTSVNKSIEAGIFQRAVIIIDFDFLAYIILFAF